MATKIRRPWTLQSQIDAYQSMKWRTFWSQLFLFALFASIAALILAFKFDWVVGQIKIAGHFK